MRRFRLAAVGRPYADHKHGGVRAAASLVAAIAGAVALMLAGFVILGSVSLADATWVLVATAVLLGLWLSGMWWRWDAPDGRDPHHERERRGF